MTETICTCWVGRARHEGGWAPDRATCASHCDEALKRRAAQLAAASVATPVQECADCRHDKSEHFPADHPCSSACRVSTCHCVWFVASVATEAPKETNSHESRSPDGDGQAMRDAPVIATRQGELAAGSEPADSQPIIAASEAPPPQTEELEPFREQLRRVEQMTDEDCGTWDLSENDIAALKAVLADRQRMAKTLNELRAEGRKHHWGQNHALTIQWLRGAGYEDAADALLSLHVDDLALMGIHPYPYPEALRGAPPGPSRLRALELGIQRIIDKKRAAAAAMTIPNDESSRGSYIMTRNSVVAEADELESLLHGSPGGTRKDAPE